MTLETTAVIVTEPLVMPGVKVVVVDVGFEKLPCVEDHKTDTPRP